MSDRDLFGEPITTLAAVRKDSRERKIGYAARPGTGPRKQRCQTCRHAERVLHRGSHSLKCRLMAHAWTHSAETDIQPRAPACAQWERRPLQKVLP